MNKTVLEVLEEQAIGIPINKAVELLKQILGIENETIKRLDRIERKVDRLLAIPYKAAMEHVESASTPGLSNGEQERRLDLARDRLIDAIGAAGTDLTSRCAAEVALASLHYLRQQHADAIRYAIRAYHTSVYAVSEAVDQANVIKVGRFSIARIRALEKASNVGMGFFDFIGMYPLDYPRDLAIALKTRNRQVCYELRDRSVEVRKIAERIGAARAEIPEMELLGDSYQSMTWKRRDEPLSLE